MDAHVVHRLQAVLDHVAAGVGLFKQREGQTAEQLVVVLADHVAAHRAEIAIADVPALNAIGVELHIGHLVLQRGRRAAGEKVGRFGDVGIAIDDLDALEHRIESAGLRGIVNLADHAAGGVSFGRPVLAGRSCHFLSVGVSH